MILLLGVGCASGSSQGSGGPGAKNASSTSDDSGVVCHPEASTGTNISHMVCRSQEQRDADRKAAQDFAQKPRPATSKAQ